ncbi:MAG: 2-hydroxyacyl-CoA dehydratase [Candidatus Lokiarchaeota archaeon]|nr:2-hydroxyacyl-CoA dehydratase [Candidatus Lokiarchaeota archaeon]
MKGFDALERALGESGRPVVCCFPLYPPLELFHAMGFNPIVLWGLKPFLASTSACDKHVQTFACSVGRHLTEFLLSGDVAGVDSVFFYNACDTLRNLPEILSRNMIGAGRQAKFYHFHVPMQGLGAGVGRDYFKGEVGRLASSLEKDCHVAFSNRNFQDSVEKYRKMRGLHAVLQERVARGQLGFGRYARAVHEGHLVPVEAAIDTLQSLAREPPSNPRREGLHRVMLSGIMPPPPELSDAIERAGLVVAANDIASMHRSFRHTPRFNGDVGDYYVDFYSRHCPCPTLLFTADQRAGYLADMAKDNGVEGVIFVGEKFCEYEYLEFPHIEKIFKQNGIHVLSLEVSIDDRDNVAPLEGRIEAFAELLGSEGP